MLRLLERLGMVRATRARTKSAADERRRAAENLRMARLRRDTRAQHAAAETLRNATHEALRAEVGQ